MVSLEGPGRTGRSADAPPRRHGCGKWPLLVPGHDRGFRCALRLHLLSRSQESLWALAQFLVHTGISLQVVPQCRVVLEKLLVVCERRILGKFSRDIVVSLEELVETEQ